MNKPVITGNTIIVPSSLEYLTDVDVFVEGILRGYGTDESTIADIAISVSELVNNAVAHGSQADEEKLVKVGISREDNTVSITVSDEGTGFCPDEIADPLADENLLKEVGRGIFIVRSLMDQVDIDATDDGTTITISKAIK